ncbi:MAG: hypothetical protein WA672_06360 [Candidatus Angelobacter sp.]
MRMNFEFTEERIQDLQQLREDIGAESMKDLANNAFTLLEWAVNETKNGNEIAAVNEREKVYRVLIMPLLRNVARAASARASSQALAKA